MSGNFDKHITYLSVINITEDDSNNLIGTVLGEISNAKDVEKFNAIPDKSEKIIAFNEAIKNLTALSPPPGNILPLTTTIIIEGLVSDNQYEFAKINSGDLKNFNTYTLADKKTKVQELITSVLLSGSSSSVGKGESESVDSSEQDECKKLPKFNTKLELTNLIVCLETNNPDNNNVMIAQIITRLKEKVNTSFTNANITEILSTAMSADSVAIIKKCITSKKDELIEVGKGKSINVKNAREETISIGEEFIPSSILDSAITICGKVAAIAIVVPILSTLAFYASVIPSDIVDTIGVSLLAGGRPKKKTRKRKSRKSKKSKKSRKGKGKGRSRKIKRKHR